MVRLPVLQRLYNLSDAPMEYPLLDRMSDTRGCGLAQATHIPDRTTVWVFENRMQRQGHRNTPLSKTQQRPNQGIAKTRARVEQAFAAIELMGGTLIRPIGQARAHFAMTMRVACYNLKRLAYCQRVGIVPA
jgi:IS5 family transposase